MFLLRIRMCFCYGFVCVLSKESYVVFAKDSYVFLLRVRLCFCYAIDCVFATESIVYLLRDIYPQWITLHNGQLSIMDSYP